MRVAKPTHLFLLTSGLQVVLAQRNIRKFNFLPLASEKAWGIHLKGHPTSSFNEWNLDSPFCGPLFNNYTQAFETQQWHLIGDLIFNTTQCILNNSSVLHLQTIQSSAVLLGLVPILLSTAGPSLMELALLSLRRPFLAALLSLGTAAVFPTRPLSFYDDTPRIALNRMRMGPTTRICKKFLPARMAGVRRSRACFIILGFVEYVLALAAVFNVMYTSWQLGTNSIYVLDCVASYFPLLWVIIPVSIHGLMCGAFHLDYKKKKKKRKAKTSRDDVELAVTVRANPPPSTTSTKWSRLALHIIPSAAQPSMLADVIDEPSMVVDLVHKISTMLGFAQVIYGVIIFSSCIFVAAADAAAILLRYLASVVVCRVLVAFDLGAYEIEGDLSEEDLGCNLANIS